MEADFLGIMHSTFHDFTLGRSGMLDGFIDRFEVNNWSVVQVPSSTHGTFLSVHWLKIFHCHCCCFALPMVWAVLRFVHAIMLTA
jgi:hypothetical protein